MKKIAIIKLTAVAIFGIAAHSAVADDIGSGFPWAGFNASEPEAEETCTSTLECAWQDLLDVFEPEGE